MKEINGPARDRTRYNSNNKVAVHEFKPYASFGGDEEGGR